MQFIDTVADLLNDHTDAGSLSDHADPCEPDDILDALDLQKRGIAHLVCCSLVHDRSHQCKSSALSDSLFCNTHSKPEDCLPIPAVHQLLATRETLVDLHTHYLSRKGIEQAVVSVRATSRRFPSFYRPSGAADVFGVARLPTAPAGPSNARAANRRDDAHDHAETTYCSGVTKDGDHCRNSTKHHDPRDGYWFCHKHESQADDGRAQQRRGRSRSRSGGKKKYIRCIGRCTNGDRCKREVKSSHKDVNPDGTYDCGFHKTKKWITICNLSHHLYLHDIYYIMPPSESYDINCLSACRPQNDENGPNDQNVAGNFRIILLIDMT